GDCGKNPGAAQVPFHFAKLLTQIAWKWFDEDRPMQWRHRETLRLVIDHRPLCRLVALPNTAWFICRRAKACLLPQCTNHVCHAWWHGAARIKNCVRRHRARKAFSVLTGVTFHVVDLGRQTSELIERRRIAGRSVDG